MVFTACSYLALAGAVWIFLRLVQACFWLPRHLKRQNQVQQMLQDKVESYEKYVLDCERKEMMEQEMQGVANQDLAQTEQWKERRECLEMLKKELNNVRNGVDDPPDWDYFLKEEETEKEESSNAEKKDPKITEMENSSIAENQDPNTTEKENSSITEKNKLNITEKEKSSITEILEDDISIGRCDHEINANHSVMKQITASENKKDK